MSRTNPNLVTSAGVGNFARLKALSKTSGRPIDAVAGRFTLEAAIRRIFASEHADRFGLAALKGGSLMFFSEGVDPVHGRGTSDIDIALSGYKGSMTELGEIMRDVLGRIPTIDDGVRFDVDAVTVIEREGEDGVPGGAVTTRVQIGGAVFAFKVDVGLYSREHAQDMIAVDYPSLLPGQLGSVRIWRQPVEHSLTDKIHAAVKHGGLNTRLRDFYNMYCFCAREQLDDDRIRSGFGKWQALFNTEPPASIDDVYSPAYVAEKAAAWDALRRSAGWSVPVPDLAAVVETIRDRLEPVVKACQTSYGA